MNAGLLTLHEFHGDGLSSGLGNLMSKLRVFLVPLENASDTSENFTTKSAFLILDYDSQKYDFFKKKFFQKYL